MADSAVFTLSLADKITGPAKSIVSAFDQIAGTETKVTGALAPIVSVAGQVGGALVSMATVAVEAILGLAAAIAATTVALAAFAIKAGEAKTQLLTTFSALTGGAAQGAATLKIIDNLGASLGMTRAELGPYATKLLEAGVSANKLEASLRAVAAANAMIAGSGEKVTELLSMLQEQGAKGTKLRFSARQLVGTGVSEEELLKALGMTPKMFELAKKKGTLTGQQLSDAIVKVLGAKGAGPLANQANKLTSIWLKFKESITKLFDDVTSSPGYKQFIDALKKFFSFGTAATGQLKTTITSMFSSLFSWASKVLPYIKLWIERAIIAVLKAYIAVKLWYKEGGKKDVLQTWTAMVNVLKPLAPILLNAAKVALAFLIIAAKFQAIGVSASQGLAAGIRGGIPAVVAAVHAMGQAAVEGLKKSLLIASPSKVFANLGGFTAAGFQGGIQGGSKGVKAASAGMASQALQGAAGSKGAAGKPGAAPRAGGGTINVQPGAITITGATGDAAALTESALVVMLERVRKAQGV